MVLGVFDSLSIQCLEPSVIAANAAQSYRVNPLKTLDTVLIVPQLWGIF